MKVLYLLRQEPDATAKEIIEAHREFNDVTVIDLAEEKDYKQILSLIETSDKVFTC